MWKHKTKHKDKEFKSSYDRSSKDRVFTLTNGKKVKSYESWQAAKKDGWEKVN